MTVGNTTKADRFSYVVRDEQGIELRFNPDKFEPIGFADLQHGLHTMNYSFIAHVDPGNLEHRGETNSEKMTIRFPISFFTRYSVYCLLKGGCLPINMAEPKAVLFDRNTISHVNNSILNKGGDQTREFEWWMNFVKDRTIHLNPLLHGIEGNRQRVPTLEEFKQSITESSEKLSTYFPNATIATHTPATLDSVYQMVRTNAERSSREVQFLLDVEPLIREHTSDRNLVGKWEKILERASHHRLVGNSLAVIASAATLFEDKNSINGRYSTPARKLLKPKNGYKENDAFNAISDLRHLEIYCASWEFSDKEMVLCTCDWAMALFWCGLQCKEAALMPNGSMRINMEPTKLMCPRITDTAIEQLSGPY